jgi:NADH/F420H2 dehydrogenase subunit C
MDREKLKEIILNTIPEATFEENKQYPVFIVPAGTLRQIALKLKNDDQLAFDYLFCLTGVDFGKELGVVYHLESSEYRHEVVLKVKTADRETPAFDTVADIWRSAEFYEREVYDLLGIRFNGHPDLRKIFLDENWVGYPLRKDYTDEVNIVEL